MKFDLFINKFKLLSEKQIAFFIVFLIAVVYLHPVFLGKVDAPIDVRNVLMYPWRHYAVDERIKIINLWKNTEPILHLQVPSNSTTKAALKIEIDQNQFGDLTNLTDSNYYLSFDFKTKKDYGSNFNLGLLLINKSTQEPFVPAYTVSPLLDSWNKAYFNLNKLFKKLKVPRDLNNYELIITAENKDKNNVAFFDLRDLKLVCEDFSSVPKVHNYYINDLIQIFVPFREYYSNSIKKMQLPFWNNYIFGGTEFLAEPQVGYFHPLYFLTYFLFDYFTAHSIIIFVCLVLSGIGAFILARFWNFSFYSSVLVSVVYMFNPFNATWFSYEHMLMNSAALPFLLLSYEKNLIQNKLLNKYLIVSSLLLGLIFLSGHLQYVYYTSIFFLLFALYLFIRGLFLKKSFFVKHTFSILFVFSSALLIGLVVLLPFYPLLENSHRVSNSLNFIKSTSFPLKAFLGLIYPFYGGYLGGSHTETTNMDPKYVAGFFNHYIYFGILPFLFFILSLRTLFSNKLTLFFVIVIFVSFLICTGSGLFLMLRNVFPGFSKLQHYRFLQLYSYSIPFLVGIGFDIFCKNTVFFKEKIIRVLAFLIVLITTIDLMCYSSFFITWSSKGDYKALPKSGSLEFLINEQKNSKEPFRVLPFSIDQVGATKLKVNIAQPNTLLPFHIEDVSGYSSFIPKDLYNLFIYLQTKNPNLLYTKEMVNVFSNPNIPFPIYNFKSKVLDLLNVKYFLVPSVLTIDSSYAGKVFDGDCAIYENKSYLPRAFVVTNYKIIDSPKDTIVYLDSEEFNPRQEVILMACEEHSRQRPSLDSTSRRDGRGSRLARPAPPAERGERESERAPKAAALKYSVNFLKYEQDNITLMVGVNSPGFLVLGNNLNDNWRVKINKEEGKHIQANLVQRAVYLPKAGTYKIEFYYFPKLFLIGSLISFFTVLILITFFLALRKRETK